MIANSGSYEMWYNEHIKRSSGERKRRLQEGHPHAEQMFAREIWQVSLGNFDFLHPQYEIADYKDGTRFLDFAYIRYPLRLAIEVDGYWKNPGSVSRWKFSDTLMRQNHLILDGWFVLRFSYDDIAEKPRMCQQVIQQFLGNWFANEETTNQELGVLEIQIIRHLVKQDKCLKIQELSDYLQMSPLRTRKLLRAMLTKKIILPAGKSTQRIHYYKLNKELITPKKIRKILG